jgi:hypothetical protein
LVGADSAAPLTPTASDSAIAVLAYRAGNYFLFASGLVRARNSLMNSVAIGFGVRSLTVMISTGRVSVRVGKIFSRRPAQGNFTHE